MFSVSLIKQFICDGWIYKPNTLNWNNDGSVWMGASFKHECIYNKYHKIMLTVLLSFVLSGYIIISLWFMGTFAHILQFRVASLALKRDCSSASGVTLVGMRKWAGIHNQNEYKMLTLYIFLGMYCIKGELWKIMLHGCDFHWPFCVLSVCTFVFVFAICRGSTHI